MSLDTTVAELLASVAALTAAVQQNNANLDRVIAGQEAAMAKLEGATSAPRTRRTSKATDAPTTTEEAPVAETAKPEPVAVHALLVGANNETAKNGKGEDEPTKNYRAADFTKQEVKNEFIGWLGDTDSADERKKRAAFVGELAQNFGVAKPFDPAAGINDPEHLKQTLFFLRRKRAGLPVDFSADYDFDADPLEQVAVAEEEDPLG